MGPREMSAAKVREASILVVQAWATYEAAGRSRRGRDLRAAYDNLREAIRLMDEAIREGTARLGETG